MKLFIYAAMMILTLGVTGIMNSAMKKRNFKVNTWLNVLITSALTVLLLVTEDTSIVILQGIAFFHVLLFASVQDISIHEADDFLWVMLLILAIPNMETVGLLSMAFAGGMLFLPQIIVSMICKNAIGGADIKISTAAAVFLGVTRGLVGFIIGLTLAVIIQSIYKKVKHGGERKAFALVPYLSIGFAIGYLI